jgi:hypothetical protein
VKSVQPAEIKHLLICSNVRSHVTSTLDVVWTTRSGGGGRRERRYLDFVIDGVTLSSRLNADFISPFGWLDADEQEASIDRLLRKSPPDMPQARTTLYVCPECGDIGCGAVTLSVQRGDGIIIWKNFGVQNNYEDVVHTDGLEDIGPFTFDGRQYHELFERVRRLIRS